MDVTDLVHNNGLETVKFPINLAYDLVLEAVNPVTKPVALLCYYSLEIVDLAADVVLHSSMNTVNLTTEIFAKPIDLLVDHGLEVDDLLLEVDDLLPEPISLVNHDLQIMVQTLASPVSVFRDYLKL